MSQIHMPQVPEGLTLMTVLADNDRPFPRLRVEYTNDWEVYVYTTPMLNQQNVKSPFGYSDMVRIRTGVSKVAQFSNDALDDDSFLAELRRWWQLTRRAERQNEIASA